MFYREVEAFIHAQHYQSGWLSVGDVQKRLEPRATLNQLLFCWSYIQPRNRGKLMLNAFNAHRNGSSIHRVGADLKELHGAVAFELPLNAKEREDFLHVKV